MERKVKKEKVTAPIEKTEVKIPWKKIGGGSARLIIDGKYRILKPNERFEAALSEIPLGIRDVFQCMDDDTFKEAVEAGEDETAAEGPKYELEVKSPGWYNVVNIASRKPMNKLAMRKSDAEDLLAAL